MSRADFMTTLSGVRTRAAAALHAVAPSVIELSRDIHAHPEESFLEWETSTKLRAFCSEQGFTVAEGSPRLPTSFTARYGSGDIVIGIVAEYDALPNGHACGHNIILGAALATACALATVADELGITVKVIGAPAEEHGGGKVYLLQDGVFDDVHAALMVHAVADGMDQRPFGSTSQAVARWRVTYTGRSSHAAGNPELGINAADAVVVAQVAVGLLRQQIKDGYRTNMLIRDAGTATNIIAEKSVVDFEVRAPELSAFHELHDKVLHCFEAGALATGCTMEVEPLEPLYEPIKNDAMLSRHWCANYSALGRSVEPRNTVHSASTDFGNVGQFLPAIHPWISIPGVTDALHSDAFRENAVTQPAFETMLDGALTMALTVIDTMTTPDDVAYLREQLAQRVPLEVTRIPGDSVVAGLLPPEGFSK